MSDRVRRGALALWATAAVVSPLHAQTVAQLRERVDRLSRAYATAYVEAHRADSVRRALFTVPPESATVGALHVFATAAAIENARAGARAAWPLLDGTSGPAAAMLDDHAFFLQAERSGETARPVSGRTNHQFLATNEATDIGDRLVWQASQVLVARLDPALRDWMGGAIVPSVRLPRLLPATYLELLTAPSATTRRCFAGAVAGCRDAFDLPPTPDPYRRWYGPEERRVIVQQVVTGNDVLSVRDLYQQCVTRGDDAACLRLLQRQPLSAIPQPLGDPSRLELVQLALELGGRGAFSRLMAARGQPVDAQIAAAAGMPADSLLLVWRARVLAARPRPVTLNARGAWVALMWGLVFGLLAFGSTRWR